MSTPDGSDQVKFNDIRVKGLPWRADVRPIRTRDISEEEFAFYNVFDGELRKVSETLQRLPELVHHRDAQEETLLHWAAESRNTEMAKLLLVANADPNVCNTHGATPLTSAARVPYRPMYDTLIMHGAIVKESDYGRADEILQKEFSNLLPDFFKSIKEGDEKRVVDFLEQGVPPNSVDRSSDVRCTALHYAADRHSHNCVQSTYLRIVEHLLKANADPNVRDSIGSTAGHDVRSPILLAKMYKAGLHLGLPGVEKSRNYIGVGLHENLCLKNRDVLE